MDIRFNLVGVATGILIIDDTLRIGIDPALAPAGTKYIYKGLKTKRVLPPVYDESTFVNIPLWLLTHSHFDHIDEPGLKEIQNGTEVASHPNCAKILKKRNDLNVSYLKWNESRTYNLNGYEIIVTAVPASHGTNWFARFLMGGVSGYVITITNEDEAKTIYLTSDTVYYDALISTLKKFDIDIIIANMGGIKPNLPGGPFTMTIDMLKQFENALKPKRTQPIHIDDFSHYEMTRDEVAREWRVINNGETVEL